jgi:hypothetical protein
MALAASKVAENLEGFMGTPSSADRGVVLIDRLPDRPAAAECASGLF